MVKLLSWFDKGWEHQTLNLGDLVYSENSGRQTGGQRQSLKPLQALLAFCLYRAIHTTTLSGGH